MVAMNHEDKLVHIAIGQSRIRQFLIVKFETIENLFTKGVSQGLIIENFVPQNYLAVWYFCKQK